MRSCLTIALVLLLASTEPVQPGAMQVEEIKVVWVWSFSCDAGDYGYQCYRKKALR